MGCNPTSNKTPESIIFAKRKSAFKIRIDSLRGRGVVPVRKSKAASKKRVRFGDRQVLFRHVPEEELQQSWYQSNEYDAFKSESKITLAALKQAHGNVTQLDASKHCLRGLEAHVSLSILKLRQMMIRSTVQIVLDQQKVQRSHGVSDPNMIGAVSMMFSKQARQRALSFGALDTSFLWSV